MAEIHINVGIAALARGFLTLETFAQGIQSLAQTKEVSIQDLWVGKGLLSAHQLETVMQTLNATAVGSTQVAKRQSEPRKGVPLGPATAPTAPSLAPPPPQAAQATVLVAPVDVPSMLPGASTVGGRYKRLFTLGTGGLGEVEACEDLLLGRT